MKNIMVTGNLGYVGNVLVSILASKGYCIHGYDIGYFADCNLGEYQQPVKKQTIKDIRDITEEDFYGIDAVIHLAGLSNDPLGDFSPKLTEEINLYGTLKAAELAKKAGVKRFIYASSQSMYGVAPDDIELSEDESEKNAITVYARTKWEAEQALRDINGNGFSCVYFRPSTVFGASPNLRCDIVYNNLVACAYTTGKIEIKSDGTPWRPVVHVRDVSMAFIAGIEAPLDIVENRAFNIGIPNGNFSVRNLAEAARNVVGNSTLAFTGEHADSRTYKVSFSRILHELKDYFNPEWDLQRGGHELIEYFNRVGFTEKQFRGSNCTRLLKLKELIDGGKITESLRIKR